MNFASFFFFLRNTIEIIKLCVCVCVIACRLLLTATVENKKKPNYVESVYRNRKT